MQDLYVKYITREEFIQYFDSDLKTKKVMNALVFLENMPVSQRSNCGLDRWSKQKTHEGIDKIFWKVSTWKTEWRVTLFSKQ
jgi:hypothetical protein